MRVIRHAITALCFGLAACTATTPEEEATLRFPAGERQGELPGTGPFPVPTPDVNSLPKSRFGDGVDWMEALRTGQINPRRSLDRTDAAAQESFMDLDIMMTTTGSMPNVLFSHASHTQWLSCSSCHPRLFQPVRGANPMTMREIAHGEYCGVCHGSVAFPVAHCKGCHVLN